MRTILLIIVVILLSGVVWGQVTVTDKMYQEVSPAYKEIDIDPNKVLRIETELSAFWKGVNSCNDRKRLISNTDEVALKWVKDKLFENRYSKLIKFGWYYENPNISNSQQGFPDRVRSCTGLVKFIAFIEFEK